MNTKTVLLALAIVVSLPLGVWAASKADVSNLVGSMPLAPSVINTVNAGFQRGIDDGRLTVDEAFGFLQRIATSGAAIEDRQTILLAIAQSLLEDLPVEMLVNKVDEGLARGLPLDVVAKEIVERRQTLIEVRALMAQKGVTIQQQPNGPGFARTAVDAAITDSATVLESHIRSGKKPNDGTLLNATLTTLQRDGRVPSTVFSALAGTLGEADLARVATNIESRI